MEEQVNQVLVVEDDEAVAEVATAILESAGYEVVTVSSGADALAFLSRVRARYLVLLDLHMADMDGWEVLSTLRVAELRHHPVVVVSAASRESFPAGVPALHKPFSARQLLDAVAGARN